MSALERRIDADLELGVEGGLIAELEALIVEHPLRERLRGQLILALYRDGRQAEALEVYRETRRVLADELGLEPSPALRDLERAILRQDPALAAAAPRPPRSEVLAPPGVVLVLASGLGLAAWIASSGVAPEPAAAPARRASVPSTGTTNVARPAAVTVTRPPLTNTAKPTTRPRLRRAATVASARPRPVASRPVPAATTRAPRPVEALRIGDDFADAAIDSTIWNVTDHSAAFLHREGRLEITVPPDAVPDRDWSQVGGHYGTRCSFRGPFDARVDYELLEWLRGNGVYAGLVAYFANAGITAEQPSAVWRQVRFVRVICARRPRDGGRARAAPHATRRRCDHDLLLARRRLAAAGLGPLDGDCDARRPGAGQR